MRLFAAILLPEEVRRGLCERIAFLRRAAREGRFTRPENLHLTLIFLGETERVPAAERALSAVCCAPFPLCFGRTGFFSRGRERIVWAGADRSAPLLALYRQLFASFCAQGFSPDPRAYTPHVTLGRRVVLREPALPETGFPRLCMTAEKISLMRSVLGGGGPRYTEIAAKRLE